jgi:excisionase family DNA binding protein
LRRVTQRFRTVRETAEELRLGLSTTYKAIAAGDIKAIRIGKAIRVADTEIDRIHRGESA